MEYKFSVGDEVIFTNDFGVCWGVRTITGLGERCGKPTYYTEPTDCPWFDSNEDNFISVSKGDHELSWKALQEKYGFKPTLEQLGGCY